MDWYKTIHRATYLEARNWVSPLTISAVFGEHSASLDVSTRAARAVNFSASRRRWATNNKETRNTEYRIFHYGRHEVELSLEGINILYFGTTLATGSSKVGAMLVNAAHAFPLVWTTNENVKASCFSKVITWRRNEILTQSLNQNSKYNPTVRGK